MTINTKYNIGDEVYFAYECCECGNKTIKKGLISDINIELNTMIVGDTFNILYNIKLLNNGVLTTIMVSECDIAYTMEEFINELNKKGEK